MGLPQADLSVMRAAARPSKFTLGEPLAIGFVPCPGRGQLVGSVNRAAGLPLMGSPFRGSNGRWQAVVEFDDASYPCNQYEMLGGLGRGVVWSAHSQGEGPSMGEERIKFNRPCKFACG